jgi:hypothetical protein
MLLKTGGCRFIKITTCTPRLGKAFGFIGGISLVDKTHKNWAGTP